MWRIFGQALVYHAAGKRRESDAALGRLIKAYSSVASYQVATVCAYRNEAGRAFEWLDRSYEVRDAGITQLIGDPLMKNVEKDPRYNAFLRKVKLID